MKPKINKEITNIISIIATRKLNMLLGQIGEFKNPQKVHIHIDLITRPIMNLLPVILTDERSDGNIHIKIPVISQELGHAVIVRLCNDQKILNKIQQAARN